MVHNNTKSSIEEEIKTLVSSTNLLNEQLLVYRKEKENRIKTIQINKEVTQLLNKEGEANDLLGYSIISPKR